MSTSSKINIINFDIPANGPVVAAARDAYIGRLATLLGATAIDCFHYSDTNSGLGIWKYTAIIYVYATDGILTIARVTCSGVAHPPSGSNKVAIADPGVGTTYSWAAEPPPVITTTDAEQSVNAPAQNNNLWVWPIPANSPAAATDFTNAISKIQRNTQLGVGYWDYFKYVDSVSGAWAVYAVAIFMGSLPQPVTYVVTCSGTPNPPTYSLTPAVSIPAFTQTFTPITAPLSFGPGR